MERPKAPKSPSNTSLFSTRLALLLRPGFFADADIQASTNIGIKGLETLGISPSKLLMVNQKVTPKPESTGSKNREKISISLEIEPENLQQLSLFEWVNGEAIPC